MPLRVLRDARRQQARVGESAQIASKFDPATGRWGLYNGDEPVFEVNVQTGELTIKGRRVRMEFDE